MIFEVAVEAEEETSNYFFRTTTMVENYIDIEIEDVMHDDRCYDYLITKLGLENEDDDKVIEDKMYDYLEDDDILAEVVYANYKCDEDIVDAFYPGGLSRYLR